MKTFEAKCAGAYPPPYTPDIIAELDKVSTEGADGSDLTLGEDPFDEDDEV